MDQFLGLHQLVLVVLVHAGLAVLQVEHGVPLPELDLIPLLQPRELLPHEGVIEWVPVGGEEELLEHFSIGSCTRLLPDFITPSPSHQR